MSEKFFPVYEILINQAIQLENFIEKRNHENRIAIKPKSEPFKIKRSCYYCGESDYIYKNCPHLKSGLLSQIEETNTKSDSTKLTKSTLSSDLLKLLVKMRASKLNIPRRNCDACV